MEDLRITDNVVGGGTSRFFGNGFPAKRDLVGN